MYQVLARQWRPKNFHELVGQTHVAEALAYALDHNRIHHAYLFTGTRGVGKTTIARIFAKSLNCLTNGVSSHPCGTCEHCLEIDAGRFPDLIEVDAASRTGVDDTRDLLDNVPYAPVKGRFKVYLIDEVHMFSRSSFNALLKTLEEPPPHVKFILATTDPQKMPATVLSRCLQFHLKNLTPRQIAAHLAAILRHEHTPFDDEALTMLARAGHGSMRDALSLLDQAIAFGQGEVRTAKVAGLLGAVPAHHFIDLMEAMAHQDCAGLRRILAEMDEYAPDYGALLAELMGQFQRVTVLQLGAQQPDEYFEPELASLAGRLPVELMQLWYQIATDTWQYFPYQPNARLAFEMMLLRMAAMQPLFPNVPAKVVADLSGGDDETVQIAARLGHVAHSHTAAQDEAQPAAKAMPMPDAQLDSGQVASTAEASPSAHSPLANPDMQTENSAVADTPPPFADAPPFDDAPPLGDYPQWEDVSATMPVYDLPDMFTADMSDDKPRQTPDAAVAADMPPTQISAENIAALPAGKADNPVPAAPAQEASGADAAADMPVAPLAESPDENIAALPAVADEDAAVQRHALPPLAATVGDVEAWAAYVQHLPKSGKVRMFADNACPVDWQAPRLTLQVPFMMTGFDDGKRLQALGEALAALCGEACEIVLVVNDDVMTPGKWRNQEKEAEQARAEQAFYAHPLTLSLQERLDAKVQPHSIQPTSKTE